MVDGLWSRVRRRQGHASVLSFEALIVSPSLYPRPEATHLTLAIAGLRTAVLVD